MDATPQPPRLGVLRRLLYAALTLPLFAALLEGTLAVADVANPLGRLSLTRGFNPAVHDFAEVPGSPGSVRTQMFTLMDTESGICARQLDDEERAGLRQACERYERMLQLSPEIPLALYELGLCTYLLGEDDARARELLRQAAHFDRAPTRGNDIINGIVRALAASAADDPGTRFVDIERWFQERCPQGLVGFEVMMDNCHLHEISRAILVDQFVAPMVELTRQVLAER